MTVAKASRRFTKLRVNEVSLVDEGDNPHADVLILKRRQIVGVDLEVSKQRLAEVRKDALAAAKLISEGGSPMNIEEMTEKLDQIEKSLTTVQGENTDLKAQIEKVTKERDEAIEKAKKAKPVPPQNQSDAGANDPATDDLEDAEKRLPAEFRKRLADAEKQAAEAMAEVEKARDEREEGVEIEKVRAVGLTEFEKMGKLIHRVRKGKSTAEDADALVDLITKAKAVREEGKALFTSIGKAAGADLGDEAQVAKAKLEEMTASIQKAKPSLTKEQAYVEAIEANPALYDQARRA